ncbi:hypothetical protein T229_07710 [Tannerella sp. oral taxon BU063 isolate Cell 5]|uniref:Uncharacterized protein n=1 Tax=Tannerella sp. oral taxon BU063 isolate Cell 5 TaxID=1410950 RepID=W2CDY0_9BACT|nr:hypothetical protein T229_07710 [Tannerella sp. oral taxon BU063 isolate Cell 5]
MIRRLFLNITSSREVVIFRRGTGKMESIVISGEVFDCSEYIKPEIKRVPAYFIKLSAIKKK